MMKNIVGYQRDVVENGEIIQEYYMFIGWHYPVTQEERMRGNEECLDAIKSGRKIRIRSENGSCIGYDSGANIEGLSTYTLKFMDGTKKVLEIYCHRDACFDIFCLMAW